MDSQTQSQEPEMSKDPNCIFCKIVAGEIPSAKILGDDSAFAFLDIGPLAEGHVLLIPAGHYETLDQMPPDHAGALLRHLPALVKAVRAATGCEGVNVLQNNGRVAHQVVPHVHFHVIPRRAGDAFHFNWPAGKYAPGRLDELAAKIRTAL
ncbi:MAG TPA: HIT family protein [Phycisphaerales bacterium]|nr:HIT family protein [Phycisphaerales bacterium]